MLRLNKGRLRKEGWLEGMMVLVWEGIVGWELN